jgi:CRISPR-associated DxTHG motif protein
MLDEHARPGHVIAIVTAEARMKAWPQFCEQVTHQIGAEPEAVEVPDGCDEREMREILERMAAALDRHPDAAVTLDITHGFRHFPLLAYAMGLYVHAMRGVSLRGFFYGMLLAGDGSPEPPAVLLDLQPIVALQDWVRAVGSFRDTGNANQIAALLEAHGETLAQRAGANGANAWSRAATQVKRAAERVREVSALYEAGLPLELGRAAGDAVKRLDELGNSEEAWHAGLPMAGELIGRLSDAAKPFVFPGRTPHKGQWKHEIRCQRDELVRQARLIDSYLDQGYLPLALGLMREWVVSVALLVRQSEDARLVDKSGRLQAERYLGALAHYVKNHAQQGLAAPDERQRRWGQLWNQLGDLRNALHHHGMRIDELKPRKRAEQIRELWRGIADVHEMPPPFGGGDGLVLVTSQGRAPGLLYSALCNTKPAACVVLCSEVSHAHVSPAMARADFDGPAHVLVLDDPLLGFDELKRLEQEARSLLFAADRVVANVTGGTSLMGTAVQHLAEAALRLGRPVRRFALIDRRPRDAQHEDPFVQSGIYWLDDEVPR